MLGRIADIQRFSVHDGPGIRTTVFLRGCGMRCAWCHNPQFQRAEPELWYRHSRCVDCGDCADVCPLGALSTERLGRVDFDRCTHCALCTEVCPSGALSMVGESLDVTAVVARCMEDEPYYLASGGGVTLSGGEAVLQHRFLAELLPALRARGVHLLLQTAGHYRWSHLQRLLPHLDMIYYDYKVAGEEARRWTGQPATQIRANLRRLLEEGVNVQVRTPVVPGVNDDTQSARSLAADLRDLGVGSVQLLDYNALWESSLEGLDTPARALGHPSGSGDLPVLRRALTERGITPVP